MPIQFLTKCLNFEGFLLQVLKQGSWKNLCWEVVEKMCQGLFFVNVFSGAAEVGAA
jgi:hypothetical protein